MDFDPRDYDSRDDERYGGDRERGSRGGSDDDRDWEGLAREGELHPIQQCFVEHSAFQCGFCTPGFILMAKELLERHPHPTLDEIRHYLSGNLCRCASYPDILKAVSAAATGLSPGLRGPEPREQP